MNTQRRIVRHCSLCREENHNIRTCPQINILDQQHLDRIQRFLFDNDVHTVEGGIRYRFAWLQERELIELRVLAKKHGLAYRIMDKRDLYRALKRIYIVQALQNIETYYATHTIQYYSHLYRTISLIEFLIRDIENGRFLHNQITHHEDIKYTFISNEEEIHKSFDCPICYETIEEPSQKIQFNCKHVTCNGCYKKYHDTIMKNLYDWRTTYEMCIPKCPVCRSIVHTLSGDLQTLHTNYLRNDDTVHRLIDNEENI